MVIGCTIFAAAAQIMLKFGAGHPQPALIPAEPATWMPFALALLGNFPLVAGYVLSGFNAMLLILALRHGELSVLYPMVSISYVFAMIWSRLFFKEQISMGKVTAVALILAGVICIGIGGH